MATTDERSAGMPGTGRFGKLRTLAGRVLRRGPVGPEPVQRRAPVAVAPTGECTARWCLAHDHGPRASLAANGALALAQRPTPLTDVVGTELEMPIGQGVRALLLEHQAAAPEEAPAAPEHDAGPSEATTESPDAAALAATPADDEAPAHRPADEAGADSRNTAPARDSEALVPEVLPPIAHTA